MPPVSPVPGEERLRGAERCSLHGAAPSVASCDGCGRELCLACAIPVRGRTLGAECLVSVLGEDAPVPAVAANDRSPSRQIAVVAFGVAVIATLLPWSRFGQGGEPFGAWGRVPSWSLVAAVAAIVGLGACAAARVQLHRVRTWSAVAAVAGAFVVAGSILAIVRPPSFTSPWLGPWIALAAGLAATVASSAPLWATRGTPTTRS